MPRELPSLIRREVPRNNVSGKSLEGYTTDAYFVIDDNLLGKIAVVKKWTRYVNNPADVMMIPLESDISQLTELDNENGARFMEICLSLATAMHDKLGYGSPVIAINQQADCHKLPRKYSEDGTEVKVQTIDQLHAHVFIEDELGIAIGTINGLSKEDKYCFNDPLAEVVGEIMFSPSFLDEKLDGITKILVTNQFPMGIKFIMERNLTGGSELFSIVNAVQTRYVNLYRKIEAEILENDYITNIQARRNLFNRLSIEFRLTRRSRAILFCVLNNLRNYSEEERKFMRFVQGPALTWIVCEDKDHLTINLSPRILSRGNASESLGIWVEPINSENVIDMENEQNNFFHSLNTSLQGQFNVCKGPLLSKNE